MAYFIEEEIALSCKSMAVCKRLKVSECPNRCSRIRSTVPHAQCVSFTVFAQRKKYPTRISSWEDSEATSLVEEKEKTNMPDRKFDLEQLAKSRHWTTIVVQFRS